MTPPSPVVLVTGATSGIGRATARLLAQRGYRVFGTGRRPEAATLDGFELLKLDVTDDASVETGVRTLLERTGGRIEVLVNNVGTGILGAAEESTAAEVRGLFEVNFFGAIRVTNAVLPLMRARKAGRIVNMSSAGGVASVPFGAYYCATKHALEAYSAGLRNELLPLGLYVSVVGPGTVSTAAGDKAPKSAHPIADYEPARSKAVANYIQGIRDGLDPERVAETILGILQSKSPAPRYPVGAQAHGTSLMRRLLPTRTFQALTRWALRPK